MILTTKEFVEIYGNKSQIKKYEKDKKLHHSLKSALLKVANRKCNIVDLGEGKFEVIETYTSLKPKILVDYNDKDLYYYIFRNIIEAVKNKYNESEPLIISKMSYANKIELINKNYLLIRNNREDASDKLKITMNDLHDFLDTTYSMLVYYMENALEKLKKENLVKVFDVLMVKVRGNDLSISNKKDTITYTYRFREATDEEKRFIIDTEAEASELFGIEDEKDKYFGKNSQLFNSFVDAKIRSKNIETYYYGYKVFYVSKKKIDSFLSWYKNDFVDDIKICNEMIMSKTKNNSEERYKRNINNKKSLSDKYLINMIRLIEITMNTINVEKIDVEEKSFKASVYSSGNRLSIIVDK